MAVLNSLYPPVIDTYMPAFIATDAVGDCKVYFSFSKYNSKEDVKQVWITVNNQFTNQSALVSPTEVISISAASIQEDSARQSEDKYFITLTQDMLAGGKWLHNQYYKVQIRFSLSEIENKIDAIVRGQNDNQFSEWSTVTLVQAIDQPILSLNGFTSGTSVVLTQEDNYVIGKVDFTDQEELESYQIKIYNQLDLDTVVYDSGIIYSDLYASNEINHFIKYGFTDGESYLMKFIYTTKGMYQEVLDFPFVILSAGGQVLDANIEAYPDENQGCVTVHVASDTERFFGNLTIRRSSSDTNFSVWYDVHTTSITDEDFLDYIWSDYTIESGVWYKYCVQKRNMYGDRGLIVAIKDPVMVTFQDMFLTSNGKQLKIKYNPQISNFKHVVSESLTQTLGSKYPYIKRNANLNYREFSIAGLISHFCDEEHLFVSENDLYKQRKDLYLAYNEKQRINEYNDFTLERTFREKVQEFLYENNIKLFRSPAEGNILVRLMNVSFSPEATLGRMIYSFTATAYEMDEVTPETLSKYSIQNVGEVNSYVLKTYEKTSQYSGVLEGNANLKDVIQSIENGTVDEGLKKEISKIDFLDLQFESEPYLINTANNVIEIVNKDSQTDKDTVLGYLIELNGQKIIVGPSGRYILEKGDVEITSLVLYNNPKISINYTVEVVETEDTVGVARYISYLPKVGQLWGYTQPNISLYEMIEDKYNQELSNGYQNLFNLKNIKIEANPGAVFYIRDLSSEDFKRFIIGDTGYLNLESEDYAIVDFYAAGINLSPKPILASAPRDDEYVEYLNKKYNSITDIEVPVDNGVYLVKNFKDIFEVEKYKNKYTELLTYWQEYKIDGYYKVIYYKKNWYMFSVNNDVLMPIDILVDYYCELEKGEY